LFKLHPVWYDDDAYALLSSAPTTPPLIGMQEASCNTCPKQKVGSS
jgi:hypothetical protein